MSNRSKQGDPNIPSLSKSDWRFPCRCRLLTAKDFKRVFQQPIKQGDKHLTLLACVNSYPHARLGLAVPKRQLKRAVDRNRIKRLIRESFRKHQAQLQGLDVVVLVRHGIVKLDNKTVFRALDKHWNLLSKKCANSLSS